jgi:hypothetical protein
VESGRRDSPWRAGEEVHRGERERRFTAENAEIAERKTEKRNNN